MDSTKGRRATGNAPYVYLAANLKSLTRDGDQRDIVRTILTEMGVDTAKFESKLKGAVLTGG